MKELSGHELLGLRDAIVGALADANDLDELVLYALDKRLGQMVAPDGWDATVRKLLQYTEARGVTAEFVGAAIQRSPNNKKLREVAAVLEADDGAGQFERIVKEHLGFSNTDDWSKGMIASMNAVCRVEQSGQPIGTGFLVGPSTIITNHHVSHDAREQLIPASQLTFRFDYKLVNGHETKGVVYGNADNSYVDHNSQLDCTVVRLTTAAGNQTLGELSHAPKRGWLRPQDRPMRHGDPLMIIQHPKAWPQKFALGSVETGAGPASQIFHNVSTEPGSSGSPCFAADWSLVALHFWGGTLNRATLFSAILPYLNGKSIQLEV
jgi:hypothetical protein